MNTTINPANYYTQRRDTLNIELSRLSRYFRFTYPARLLSFIAFVVLALWFVKSQFNPAFLWLSTLALVLFSIAVIWDTNLARKQKHLKSRLKVNEDELKFLAHQYTHFDDGSRFSSMAPKLSGDFDLFGPGSLFQYLNRCVTGTGTELFALGLCQWSKSETIIRAKQEAVAELSRNPSFAEDFRSLGLLTESKRDETSMARLPQKRMYNFHSCEFHSANDLTEFYTNEITKLKEWLREPTANVKWLKRAGIAWPFLMASWIVLIATGIFALNSLLVPIFTAFFLVFRVGKRMKEAHAKLGKSAKTLEQYAQLVNLVETTGFNSPYLKELRERFSTREKKASIILRKFFQLLEKFDSRLNPFVMVTYNMTFLFDFHIYTALEKWKASHENDVPSWFEALGEIDALISYSVHTFNNRERVVFPELKTGDFSIDATDMEHPLLPANESVANSIKFEGQPKALIITGANMAGKSTFLRTLAVNLVLGMNGAPVSARHFSFTPCDILSSINIRDSLAKHESYFYAELSRLQGIVKHVEQNPCTLVVLDEILRGTNSRDKHNGSMGLLEKLVKLNAVVVVATHDLSIGALEEKYPEIAVNHCFEVELEGNQLKFDYKLKRGISQKLNASFLMQEMGLTI